MRRFLALTAFLLPLSAYAQPVVGVIQTGIQGCDFQTGRLSSACIPNFVAHLIAFIFSLLGVFFLANVMYGGYEIAMGGITGDKESGKRRLTWSVIGLIVAICCFIILDLILSVITERL